MLRFSHLTASVLCAVLCQLSARTNNPQTKPPSDYRERRARLGLEDLNLSWRVCVREPLWIAYGASNGPHFRTDVDRASTTVLLACPSPPMMMG